GGLGFSNRGLGFSNRGLGFSNRGLGFSNRGLGFSNRGLGFSNGIFPIDKKQQEFVYFKPLTHLCGEITKESVL
ncbi:MAG TPA: hypothetical protein H9950_01740, partial [Candidatus Bacteroides avicola]|nr:hypothetical protein [Candidatus Bacteroides avicola]